MSSDSKFSVSKLVSSVLGDGDSSATPGEASRRSFLRRSAMLTVAGGSAVVLASAGTALADNNNYNDYHKGDGELGGYFRQIRAHENQHVDFLVTALGTAARPKPTFKGLQQSNVDDFIKLAQTLENTGVGAYLGAAPVIANKDYLAAAGSIFAIEARHAGFLNVLRHDPITGNALDDDKDNAFEMPLKDDDVVAGAGAFIKSLNGGPPVAYDDKPSASNDIKILNFALALEYLEAEFYNLNVKKFFGH